MSAHIAFIRAINVAGHLRVRTSIVRDAFAAAGCRKVRSYIQSGNVIFESSEQKSAERLQKVRRKLISAAKIPAKIKQSERQPGFERI